MRRFCVSESIFRFLTGAAGPVLAAACFGAAEVFKMLENFFGPAAADALAAGPGALPRARPPRPCAGGQSGLCWDGFSDGAALDRPGTAIPFPFSPRGGPCVK